MKANSIKKILIILLVYSLPLGLKTNSFIAILTLLFLVSQRDFKFKIFGNRLFVGIILCCSILLVGFLVNKKSHLPSVELEQSFFVLALPIIVYEFRNLAISSSMVLRHFSFSCFGLIFLGFVKVLLFYDTSIRSNILIQGHVYFTEAIGGIHPTYLSMYFILISFYSLEELRSFSFADGFRKWLPPLVYLILSFAILFFLRSQMALLVFLIVIIFYFVVITRKRAWLIAFLLFSVGLITILLDSRSTLTKINSYGRNVSTALDNRVVLWRAVIEGVKGSIFLGAGTGSEQALINDGYKQVGFMEGIESSFNAHNQYLQFICRNGLVELGAFMGILIYCFWKAQRQENFVFMLFLISFSLLMFTESCLNTQRGIVFFYFFVSVFVFLPYKSDKTVPHPTLDKSII